MVTVKRAGSATKGPLSLGYESIANYLCAALCDHVITTHKTDLSCFGSRLAATKCRVQKVSEMHFLPPGASDFKEFEIATGQYCYTTLMGQEKLSRTVYRKSTTSETKRRREFFWSGGTFTPPNTLVMSNHKKKIVYKNNCDAHRPAEQCWWRRTRKRTTASNQTPLSKNLEDTSMESKMKWRGSSSAAFVS